MILRSLPRPQRQLHVASSLLAPCQQRRAASTKASQLPTSYRPVHRDQWRRPAVPARRGLATHSTGFEGHTLPVLVHGEKYTEHGIDAFMSPEGFDLAWTQYQSMMLERLNTFTYGTADSSTRPQALVEKYARSTDKASLFNHASMAANNHFFFKCLSPTPTEPSSTFKSDIDESFSSYDTLRTELIETADAMFGPGFVWIVKDHEHGKMKLLCTYLAGTPYPGAHVRAQQIDMATFTAGVPNRDIGGEPNNPVGKFGRFSKPYRESARGLSQYNADPILGVNTWEHAYLRDYGVGGKRTYLERWWDRIDWAVVEAIAKECGPESSSHRNKFSSLNLNRRVAASFGRSYVN